MFTKIMNVFKARRVGDGGAVNVRGQVSSIYTKLSLNGQGILMKLNKKAENEV